MSQDYTKASFKKLLEKLQEESWQLELLISGFAIFGLFQTIDPLREAAVQARAVENMYSFFTLQVVAVSCYILLFNLLLHVILRGLWIGALGLRYVSGDIDYEKLNYSKKFTNYLKRKVGSFDRYISTLEDYCSVIFAVSFLLIFYVLAFTVIMITIVTNATLLIDNDNIPGWVSKGFGIPIMLFLVFGMLLTFFDFVTQGWLKKKQWISKIYFPIYWVFSFLTLSFLYRALVYNFLDNKFGKRLSLILVPVYFLILVSTSLYYNNSNYFRSTNTTTDYYANKRNYEELIKDDKGVLIDKVAIGKKVTTDSYLKVFVVYKDNIEDNIFDFNEGLKPEKDNRGLSSDIQFGSGDFSFTKKDSLKREYIKTFNDVYSVRIDSVDFDSEFIFAQSKTSELGFETYVKLDSVSQGKHLLKVIRKRIRKKDTSLTRVAQIPFWYFKD